MSRLRILYITNEIAPFLQISVLGDYVSMLSHAMHEKESEVRIFAPRFGVINERTNKLHAVIRLSGDNIIIDNNKKTLNVKVTSIPNIRLQVYFIDNDDLFKRKSVFYDSNNNFFDDNDVRSTFFCKSVLEVLKKLGWEPHIVHCHGWITSLIPMYWKTAYQYNAIFNKAKIITTLYNDTFTHQFSNIANKAKIFGMEENALDPLLSGTFTGFIKTAIQYTDVLIRTEPLIDPQFTDIMINEAVHIPYNDKYQFVEAHYNLYKNLL